MFTWQVDIPKKDRNGIPYSEHVADFVLLANGTEKIYVQRGGIYLNATERLDPSQAPAWFWSAYERITPSTRALVGLKLPADVQQENEDSARSLLSQLDSLPTDLRAALVERLAEKPSRMPQVETSLEQVSTYQEEAKTQQRASQVPQGWTCDECGQSTPLRLKGVHKAAHGRARAQATRKASK